MSFLYSPSFIKGGFFNIYIYKIIYFVPPRKHITRLQYEDNRLLLFMGKIAVYFENRMKHTNTHCGQNVEHYDVKAGGTYSNRLPRHSSSG
jgi:hypothetical protein